MNNFIANYKIILKILRKTLIRTTFNLSRRRPKLSSLELITLKYNSRVLNIELYKIIFLAYF